MVGDIVWITGAGFSQSLGGPLLSELFSEAQLDRVLNHYGAIFNDQDQLALRNVSRLYRCGSHNDQLSHTYQRQWRHAEEFLERLDIAAPSTRQKDKARLQRFVDVVNETNKIKQLGRGVFGQHVFTSSAQYEQIHLLALKLLAAECAVFLEDNDPSYEIWRPYKRWADLLTSQDTVLTFNYDRVPDVLQEHSSIRIPTPTEVLDAQRKVTGDSARVLKLHGCISWVDQAANPVHSRIVRASERFPDPGVAKIAALHVGKIAELAIASPGPTKQRRVDRGAQSSPGAEGTEAGLNWLWQAGAAAIERAQAIVIVGYSMPPSDAFTRDWLVDHVRKSANSRVHSQPLRIHLVLGPNTNDPSVARLAGLFGDIGHSRVYRRPMYSEDFLATFNREDILGRDYALATG